MDLKHHGLQDCRACSSLDSSRTEPNSFSIKQFKEFTAMGYGRGIMDYFCHGGDNICQDFFRYQKADGRCLA